MITPPSEGRSSRVPGKSLIDVRAAGSRVIGSIIDRRHGWIAGSQHILLVLDTGGDVYKC